MNLSNHRVDRRRLYQQIADDIERQILEGILPVSTKLPGEYELAEQYGVSRNVIREALKRLKEHGLVTIRTGSGTYVSLPTMKPISQALERLLLHNFNEFSVNQFYEVRRMLEPECARLAAERGTSVDIEKIIFAYEKMEANQADGIIWSNADLDFHLAIAESAHNSLVITILKPLTDSFRKVIAAGYTDPVGVIAGLKAHRQILHSIENKKPADAKKSMLDHLFDSEKRINKLGIR